MLKCKAKNESLVLNPAALRSMDSVERDAVGVITLEPLLYVKDPLVPPEAAIKSVWVILISVSVHYSSPAEAEPVFGVVCF